MKILKKGVTPPPEIRNFYLFIEFHQILCEGCLREVHHGADEKGEKRGQSARKCEFSVLRYPQRSNIFVYRSIFTKYYLKVAHETAHLMVIKEPG